MSGPGCNHYLAGDTVIVCFLAISHLEKRLDLIFEENLFTGSLRTTNKSRLF